jgi:hypothetical protein
MNLKKELLKIIEEAFFKASSFDENKKIEIYIQNGIPKMSEILIGEDKNTENSDKILCYEIYGYNKILEDEIKTWIDYARNIDLTQNYEPNPFEKAVRDIEKNLSKQKNVSKNEISSYEIFANLPIDIVSATEEKIIEFWWEGDNIENIKSMAVESIESVLKEINE